MTATPRAALPAGVWVLGFGSLLMDLSTETIHALLPLFLVGTLGVGVFAVGLIEGAAEAAALFLRVFSGALSDRLRRRKRLMVFGYALGAAAKPLFALATGAPLVVAARLVDRLGKGIRGAPRDALVADLTPPGLRGAAFGLRQALDSIGALGGPLVAIALMLAWDNDIRAVFWVAMVPAVAAVLLLGFGVREPRREAGPSHTAATDEEGASRHGWHGSQGLHAALASRPWLPGRATLASLGRGCWEVVALGAVFTLARFSEAFLVLRAQSVGLPLAWAPLAMVAMSAVYAATAYPFGKLGDGFDRRRLLAAGLVVLIGADIVLALATHWLAVIGGAMLWGLHMGMTQGLLSAMVADAAPPSLRGTAFGVFHLGAGVATLVASALAGWWWQALGPAATFTSGAALAFVTLLGLALLRPGKPLAARGG